MHDLVSEAINFVSYVDVAESCFAILHSSDLLSWFRKS